jgi:hypothetical protein
MEQKREPTKISNKTVVPTVSAWTNTPAFPLPRIPSMAAQKLQGGAHHAWLYFAGATHQRDFCQPLGVTAYKAGITGVRDPQARIEDLRRMRYGSLLLTPEQAATGRSYEMADGNGLPAALVSSNEWFLIPLSEDWLEGVAMPNGISLNNNALRITAPAGVTIEALDVAVHAMLKPRSLRDYLRTDEGRQRMIAAGRDPASWLYTSYSLMTTRHRISAAEEIYLFRPRRELPALVAALGGLLKGLKKDRTE